MVVLGGGAQVSYHALVRGQLFRGIGIILNVVIICLVAALAVCPLSAAQPMQPTPWPHEGSDLRPDPSAHWGRLENGLRYVIVPHAKPRQRVSLELLVEAGSYVEHDDERGYAHYVEHMAFRGTKEFPGSSMIQTLQRFGLSFGPHVNADTGPFQTEYRLGDVPISEAGAMTVAMKALRSIADGVLFDGSAAQKELGVILSEARERQNMLAHAARDELEFLPPWSRESGGSELEALFDRTRLAERLPLGVEKVLAAATPAKLRAFYERWYRPERMILVVAGDLETSATEDLVKQIFASIQKRGTATEPQPRGVEPSGSHSSPRITVAQRMAEPSMRLALCVALPENGPDNEARRRRVLVSQLALNLLERRLITMSERPNAPFASVETHLGHEIPQLEIAITRATVTPALWPQALAALDTEVRRAIQFGFASSEFDAEIGKTKQRWSNLTQQLIGLPSGQLARQLVFAVARGVVYTAPEDDERLASVQLASIKEEECQSALKRLFARDKMYVSIAGPSGPGIPEGAVAEQTLSESGTVVLAPYVPPAAAKPFPYIDFGPAGQVVRESHSAALDADFVEFSNGVRLTLKPTRFEPSHVRYMIRFGGGTLACPPDKPGLQIRVLAWVFGGLHALSAEEERATTAALSRDRMLSTDTGDFRMSGNEEVSKFAFLLQYLAAYFTDPAFRDEGWSRALELARQQLAPFESTAGGAAQNELLRQIVSEKPVLAFPTLEQVSDRTLEEFKTWFLPQLATSPIEITVVGDFARQTVIDAVARTFGALPARDKTDSYAQQREITFPPAPFSRTFSFKGLAGAAAIALAWPLPELEAMPDLSYGPILTNVLGDRLRLKLREEMGAAYSPNLSFNRYDALKPVPTFIAAVIEVAPKQAKEGLQAANAVARLLARDGATQEEFERACQPLIKEAESNLSENEWWLEILGTAQSASGRAEERVKGPSLYRSATLKNFNQFIRESLAKETVSSLVVLPLVSADKPTMSATDYMERAEAKKSKKDLDGAISDLDRAIELSPTLAAGFTDRASFKIDKKDYDGAINDCDRALALSPNLLSALLNRGVAKNSKGDFAGAIADYDRAVVINPNFELALSNRSASKSALGDHRGAVADYDQAITLAPEKDILYYWRAREERAAGDRVAAISDFTHWIEHYPKESDGYVERSATERAMGDFKAAVGDLDQAIAIRPNDALLYKQRAELKREMGDEKGAFADENRAKRLKVKLK